MEKRGRQHFHFVLVHGACLGAWCWYKTATLLRSAGHEVTALDMAASGVHPKPVEEVRSMSDYVQPLIEFMESLPPDDRVVLVGHSFGGATVSEAVERFPCKISVAVFVAAISPAPQLSPVAISEEGRKGLDWMDSQHQFHRGPDKPPTSFLFGPGFMSAKLYEQSPPEDLTLATLLARPHPLFEAEESAGTTLTGEGYGSVRRVYVVLEEDNAIAAKFQRWIIEHNPMDDVKVISGSDHMVMLSKPQEFCYCLQEIAQKYH
ncbi:hypothetical protein NMG60_11008088 [Bertholletia excelsa]